MRIQGDIREGDLIVLVPQTSQACSAIANFNSYAVTSTDKIENVDIFQGVGQFIELVKLRLNSVHIVPLG